MELGPREHEPQLSARKTAVHDLEAVYPDLGLSLSVASVEMRVPVVVEEHRDHDPVEAADRRHAAIMGRRPDATCGLPGRQACDTVDTMLDLATTRLV